MNAGKVGESEKAPMLQRLLQYRYSPSNELMPERDIISECMGHLCVFLPSRARPSDPPSLLFTSGSPVLILHPPRSHTSSGSSAAVRIF